MLYVYLVIRYSLVIHIRMQLENAACIIEEHSRETSGSDVRGGARIAARRRGAVA